MSEDLHGPTRRIKLQPILPPVPLHRRRKVLDRAIDSTMSSEILVVRREYDVIVSRPVRTDSIVRVRVGGVEIEDEEEVSSFEDDDFIRFVFQRNVRLRMASVSTTSTTWERKDEPEEKRAIRTLLRQDSSPRRNC